MTQNTHGGKGRGQGRKPLTTAEPTVKVAITLLPSQVEAMKELGDGNLSAGIRKAIDMTTQPIERINIDDNTAVDWKGPGYYEAFTISGEERYIWQQVSLTDNPGGETVHALNWKHLVGEPPTTPKRW